jgi:hypothetical protein
VIRTKLLPKFSEVFYPILHFSLGPRNVGSRSTTIDEAYGYLWLLVQDPDTGALKLFLVNDVDRRPYNWYSRSDIPSTISLSNPVSLYLPNSENIAWATFAFTEEGEPLFAVQRDLPGHKKIEVYDRNGNVWLEITNAKSPFIVPEALINRKVFGSNVYVFYVTSSDTEIRYQGVVDYGDFGVLTSVPVNARNDLFMVDYTYRKDGIELVYSTVSRSYVYVHVEAEAYHVDEEALVVSSSFFERIQKAIRNISRMGAFPRLEKNLFKTIYLNSLTEDISTKGFLTKGVVEKIREKETQDGGEAYTSSIVNSVQKIFVSDNADPDEINTSVEGLTELRSVLLSLEPGDDARASSSYSGDYYRKAYSLSDDLSNSVFSSGDNYRTYSLSDDLSNSVFSSGDNYRTSYSSSDDLSYFVFSNGDHYRTSYSSSDDLSNSVLYSGDHYRTAYSSYDDLSDSVFSSGDYYRTVYPSSDELSSFVFDLEITHNKQFVSQNSDDCIMDSSLYMRFRQTAS